MTGFKNAHSIGCAFFMAPKCSVSCVCPHFAIDNAAEILYNIIIDDIKNYQKALADTQIKYLLPAYRAIVSQRCAYVIQY